MCFIAQRALIKLYGYSAVSGVHQGLQYDRFISLNYLASEVVSYQGVLFCLQCVLVSNVLRST